MDSKATNQHSVPQFILRNFASGSGSQIHVFDKANDKSFTSSIGSIASAKGFYDFEVDGVIESIDPSLTKLENAASGIIRKIVEGRSLRGLGGAQKRLVALFAIVQMLRTDARRKQLKALIDSVHDVVEKAGWDPNKIKGFDFLDEEQTRVASIMSLRELAHDQMPHLLNKTWILWSTSQQHPFYISDNPVTMFNVNRDPLRGTLGLRVPGIMIYLPLTSTLCLAFLCPTMLAPVKDTFNLARRLGYPVPAHVQELVAALGGETTCALDPANVRHQNSLQVFNSERFVYAGSDDFELVREMLQCLPELKKGPRWG